VSAGGTTRGAVLVVPGGGAHGRDAVSGASRHRADPSRAFPAELTTMRVCGVDIPVLGLGPIPEAVPDSVEPGAEVVC
jgi:hypothetical protein